MPDNLIEEHVGVHQPDAVEDTTPGQTHIGKHLIAEPGVGKEKEVNVLSLHSGASSDAPPSSGIPSAKRQDARDGDAVGQSDTPMHDRVMRTEEQSKP